MRACAECGASPRGGRFDPKAWEKHAGKEHCRNPRTSIRVRTGTDQTRMFGQWLVSAGLNWPANASAPERDDAPPHAAVPPEDVAARLLRMAPPSDEQFEAFALRHGGHLPAVAIEAFKRVTERGAPVTDAELAGALARAFVAHHNVSAAIAVQGARALALVEAWAGSE